MRQRVGAWIRSDPSVVAASLLVGLFLLMAVWPAAVAGIFGAGDPRACDLSMSRVGPTFTAPHPLGFDVQGCDLFANVVYGARASIAVGVGVTIGVTILAIVLGTISGYLGGWVDALISRFGEIAFAVPGILGALVLLTALGSRSPLVIIVVLTVLGWPAATRLMRAGVVAVREREYVQIARGLGGSSWSIMTRHLIRNAVAPVIVLATLNVGQVIAAEATLTFLGIGLQPPSISWGLQLSVAQRYFIESPHLLYVPAAFLILAVFSFVVLGEAVRSRLDPAARELIGRGDLTRGARR